MSLTIPVALLGFSSFERSALLSYLRLATGRTACYEQVLDLEEARFIIADADQSGVVDLLQTIERVGDAVFVGAGCPSGAAAWMMRPVDPASVRRELEQLRARQDDPASGPLPLVDLPAAPAFVAPVHETAPLPARRADDLRPSAERTRERRMAAEARRRAREAALRPVTVRRALLVDDSEVALRFLDRALRSYGLETEWALNSGHALECLAHEPFGFYFIDVDLGPNSELDGLALCQVLKRQSRLPGGRAPLVVVVSAFQDPVDRVRATLAGADAFLGKPLDFEQLDQLLVQHGLQREAPQAEPPVA